MGTNVLVPMVKVACCLSLCSAATIAAAVEPSAPIAITRAAGPIAVDGNLDDAGWAGAPAVETWFETNPGDSTPAGAEVSGRVRLSYDDSFLYAAFELADPNPAAIRAPFGGQDDINGNWTDYAGLILDTAAEGKTAQMFLATASGVKYDAISSDSSGEDNAPDFFWDAAGQITATGWNLEVRIPFATLRYDNPNPERWRLMLYRNRPRDFRYQYFTQKMPRDSACFICNGRDLVGLAGLPAGAHWTVAPYAAAGAARVAESPGADLDGDDPDGRVGLDAKWIPSPNLVVDATVEPDFSQIESDAPQIAANERFALFVPEKRPFFLESVDLFSTPLQAVYTRTVTDPRWGARATGGSGNTRWTLLVGDDEGGGLAILPGSRGSRFAPIDAGATVTIGRIRQELGPAFVSFLYAGRELDGGGSNRVAGPDFEWRPTSSDQISGQVLYSWSETPSLVEVDEAWDGRELSGHAARISWYRQTNTWDLAVDARDITEDFRADSGFVPQVGYRRYRGEVGRTWRFTDAAVRRVRLFGWMTHEQERASRDTLLDEAVVGVGLDATGNTFARLEIANDRVASGNRLFDRMQVRPTLETRPGRMVALLGLYGRFGDEVDFVGSRAAKVAGLEASAQLRPNDHLALGLSAVRRAVDLAEGAADGERLFTASVAQLRAVWTFDARSWLRLVVRHNEVERDSTLYPEGLAPAAHDEAVDASLVFSWQLNWQSVLFVGWSQERFRDPEVGLEPAGEQVFLKVSYAFQG